MSQDGKNTLGNKMKTLSEEAKLSRSYTNHCLRATSITLLDGFEARHIMTISGHKSETSIRSYSRTGNEHKKKMARTIAGALSGDDQMDGINHKEKKMQAVRLNETIAETLSGDDNNVGPSNFLNGIYHQEMTVQLNESTSGKEFAFNDMDLLELTSSQETFILNDIQNPLPIAQPQNLPRAAPPTAAPVYYFPNSTVHIHHHN